MAIKVSKDIVRFSGETYPTKGTVTIAGVPVDLTDGWRVEIRYKVPANTTLPNGIHASAETILVIDCPIIDAIKGRYSVFPYARLVGDPIMTSNDYITTDVRQKLLDQDPSIDKEINQVWDDEELERSGKDTLEYPFYVVRLKSYDTKNGGSDCGSCYIEEQVHNRGIIKILNRWVEV